MWEKYRLFLNCTKLNPVNLPSQIFFFFFTPKSLIPSPNKAGILPKKWLLVWISIKVLTETLDALLALWYRTYQTINPSMTQTPKSPKFKGKEGTMTQTQKKKKTLFSLLFLHNIKDDKLKWFCLPHPTPRLWREFLRKCNILILLKILDFIGEDPLCAQ